MVTSTTLDSDEQRLEESLKYKPAYFTAGHALYHFDIDQSVFDRSLFYNLLFRPAIGWPDHFFLSGQYVANHLGEKGYGDSWLEWGIKEGLIRPFFRVDAESFSDIFHHLMESGIKGLNIHEGPALADRLDRVLRRETPGVRKRLGSSLLLTLALNSYESRADLTPGHLLL